MINESYCQALISVLEKFSTEMKLGDIKTAVRKVGIQVKGRLKSYHTKQVLDAVQILHFKLIWCYTSLISVDKIIYLENICLSKFC